MMTAEAVPAIAFSGVIDLYTGPVVALVVNDYRCLWVRLSELAFTETPGRAICG